MKTQIGGYMNIQDYTEELIELRHHFHQHPELALQEVETSAYIRRYLEKLGYEIKPVEPTGLIAELPCLRDRKKVIVLRAEMDALPIQEQTGLSYASVNEGCMHACGHDFILASALILAKIVAEESEKFPVRIRFLFEPAEEIGEGAKRMLQAGALEAGLPDEGIFGLDLCTASMPDSFFSYRRDGICGRQANVIWIA